MCFVLDVLCMTTNCNTCLYANETVPYRTSNAAHSVNKSLTLHNTLQFTLQFEIDSKLKQEKENRSLKSTFYQFGVIYRHASPSTLTLHSILLLLLVISNESLLKMAHRVITASSSSS